MKRQWSLWRLAMACFLAGVAAVFFLYAPKEPRWVRPNGDGKVVGFDGPRGELVTARWLGTVAELRSYDLENGELGATVPLEPLHATTLMPDNWLLTPDGTRVVAYDPLYCRIGVFDRQSGKLLHRFRQAEGGRSDLGAIGFSLDSRLLAFRAGEILFLCDLTSGAEVSRIELPAEAPGDSVSEECLGHGILLSADHSYAAVARRASLSVFEMDTYQYLGGYGRARMIPAGMGPDQLLVFVPVGNSRGRRPWASRLDPKGVWGVRFFSENDRGSWSVWSLAGPALVELADEDTSEGWPHSWPASLRDLLNEWLPRRGQTLRLSVWGHDGESLGTGTFRAPEFRREPDWRAITAYTTAQGECVIALDDGRTITLWDAPPRRQPFVWWWVGGLGVLAVWFAWPRRRRVPAGLSWDDAASVTASSIE